MKIPTARFGEVELADDSVLTFPEGLPGFEGKRFVLLSRPETPTIEWLQSATEPDVAMMVLDPDAFELDYTPKPKEAELSPIRSSPEEAISFRVVVRNGEQPNEAFLNLFAPILINFAKNLAMQVPLVGSGYSVREPWPPKPE